MHERVLHSHLVPSTFPLMRGSIQHFCEIRHIRKQALTHEQYVDSVQKIKFLASTLQSYLNAKDWNGLEVALRNAFSYVLSVAMTDTLQDCLVLLHQLCSRVEKEAPSSTYFIMFLLLYRHWKRQLFDEINAPNAVTSLRRMPFRQEALILLEREWRKNHISESPPHLEATLIEQFIHDTIQPTPRTSCLYNDAMMKIIMIISSLPGKDDGGQLRPSILCQLAKIIDSKNHELFLKQIQLLHHFFKHDMH